MRAIKGVKKVGVFVNATEDYIFKQQEDYGLDMVQLHGEESPEFVERIKVRLPVIKAFKIKNKEDIALTHAYENAADYFLFDTEGKLYGGNGTLFNWELLQHYKGGVPFFLSGGIGPEEIKAISEFEHPAWMALDINSRFETAPGIKDITVLKQFLWDLNFI